MINNFWHSVGAIFETVSVTMVTETIFDAKY